MHWAKQYSMLNQFGLADLSITAVHVCMVKYHDKTELSTQCETGSDFDSYAVPFCAKTKYMHVNYRNVFFNITKLMFGLGLEGCTETV